MGRFEESAVVVTGAGSGIGFEICRRFAAEGARVALNDLIGARARDAAERLNAEVGAERVEPHAGDVADAASLRELIAGFAGRRGRLDAVVANAGFTDYAPFLDYSVEAFDRITGINLRGTFFTAQIAAREMIARGRPGRIVLMSSVTGIRAIRNLTSYSMTKAGIRMMARSMALELGSRGITVNAICPGAIVTERTLEDDPDYDANWAGVTPTGRAGRVEDVAALVAFLASPEAGHVSGQSISVDGGWSGQGPIPEGHPALPLGRR